MKRKYFKKYHNLPVTVMFLAPAFLIYTVFLFLPLILTFWYSLTTWNGVSEGLCRTCQLQGACVEQ